MYKIEYIRLKNFIPIKNSLGKDEIEIEFEMNSLPGMIKK
jgi:hypothetical protein